MAKGNFTNHRKGPRPARHDEGMFSRRQLRDIFGLKDILPPELIADVAQVQSADVAMVHSRPELYRERER